MAAPKTGRAADAEDGSLCDHDIAAKCKSRIGVQYMEKARGIALLHVVRGAT